MCSGFFVQTPQEVPNLLALAHVQAGSHPTWREFSLKHGIPGYAQGSSLKKIEQIFENSLC